MDAFVTRFNAAGTALVYSTYVGGSGEDAAYGIALDSADNAYITGYTQSADFPKNNAAQPAKAGGFDAFVTAFDVTGKNLLYSTWLGGSNQDYGWSIAVDSLSNAYITGSSNSVDYPTTAGAFQTTPGGGFDVIVTKLNATGGITWSTLVGGEGDDVGLAVAVDGSGNATIAGQTTSADFPTAAPLQIRLNGSSDAFIATLNTTATIQRQSTWLGGGGDESAWAIARNGLDDTIHLAGYTTSGDFRTTANAARPVFGGGYDAFLLIVNPASSIHVRIASGGAFDSGQTGVYTISVQNSGTTAIPGATVTDTLPAELLPANIAGAGWTCTLQPPTCSRSDTLLPGLSFDPITLTVKVNTFDLFQVINQATVFISGQLGGVGSIPTTLNPNTPPLPTGVVDAASGGQATPRVVAPNAYVAIYGSGLGGYGYANPNATSVPLPTTLNDATLLLGGLPMPLLYVTTDQVNAIVPQGLAPNATYPLVVVRDGVPSLAVSLTVIPLQPGIFTTTGTGSGAGIITDASTGARITASNPAHVLQNLVIYCTGLGVVTGPNGQIGPGDGEVAPLSPAFRTKAGVTATIGGVPATVSFVGLTPTLVAIYQVNLQVPAGVVPGESVSLILTATDPQTGIRSLSNTVTVAIK